jgi:hypothetical protein
MQMMGGTRIEPSEAIIVSCNQFFVVFRHQGTPVSVPLAGVEIAWDPAHDRIALEIHRG